MSPIRTYKITSASGDDIGIEVIEQTLKVLQALENFHKSLTLQFVYFACSSEKYSIPDAYISTNAWPKLKACGAILFGAVGSPSKYPPCIVIFLAHNVPSLVELRSHVA